MNKTQDKKVRHYDCRFLLKILAASSLLMQDMHVTAVMVKAIRRVKVTILVELLCYVVGLSFMV